MILVPVILLLIATALLYLVFPEFFHPAEAKEPIISGKAFGERVLIIAPHPDDETLGGGGVIMKQIESHKQVKVVVITSGDGYRKAVREQFHMKQPKATDFQKLGYVRHEESLRALTTLGVPSKNVLFLGYPDGGINSLWQENWDYNNLHQALNGHTHSPYPFAFEKNAPYCGENVVENLSKIIRDYQPTDIIYPDPNDVHHDHWATQAFVKYTLTLLQYKIKEWTYLVHRYDWPIPWAYEPQSGLQPPFSLRKTGTNWIDLPLTRQQEHQKLWAIMQYRSQERVMEPFLEAFVRKNDLLGTYFKKIIPSVSATPNFQKNHQLPYLFTQDPIGDTFTRKVHGAADIQFICAAHSNQYLWIVLQTRSPIANDISYLIRFRLFHQNRTVTRDDIEVKGNHIIEQQKAANSRTYASHAQITTAGTRMIIRFPIHSEWKNVYNLMLSIDTHRNTTLIDKSAWESGIVSFR